MPAGMAPPGGMPGGAGQPARRRGGSGVARAVVVVVISGIHVTKFSNVLASGLLVQL
eukprot:SAG31_NODE_424_length_15826_cov_4.954664_11_plen_57_part_00